MKKGALKFVFAVLFFCIGGLVGRADAALITIGLTAQVDNVSDPYNLLENKIHVGDTITGFYTYDSTPDSIEYYPDTRGYLYLGSHYGMTLMDNGITFQTDHTNVNFVIGVSNDSQGNDGYSAGSKYNLMLINNVLANDVILNMFFWQLTDNFGAAISTTDLPVTPPDLSKWPFNNLHISGGANDGTAPYYDKPFWINGHVTAVSLIPEPASLCFLAFGGLILCRNCRK